MNNEGTGNKGLKLFRFLTSWLTDNHFSGFVSQVWKKDVDYNLSVKEFTDKIDYWNKNEFGNIFKRKKKILARLNGIQKALESHHSDNLLKLETQLSKELNDILNQEELLWLQKSRSDWIQFGDKNTSFFHQKTMTMRRHNQIVWIKDDRGQWISDEDELKAHAINFFTNLYTADNNSIERYYIPNDFPCLDTERYHIMKKSVDDEEIRDIIFSMKPLKALGSDGLHVIFYQAQWEVVGKSVCKQIKDVFNGETVPANFLKISIVLILKIDNPTNLKFF